MRNILRIIVSAAAITVIFYFLIKHLIVNWSQIPFAALHIEYLLLGVSIVPLVVNFLLYALSWRYVVEVLDGKIGFRQAFWILSSSQLAKYIPGGIWYTLGRAYLAKAEGYNEGIITVTVIIESIILLIIGFALVLVSIMFGGQVVKMQLKFFMPLLVILPFLYTPFLRYLVNLGLRLLKKRPLEFRFGVSSMVIYSLFFILLWLAQSTGFCLFVNSIHPLGWPTSLKLVTVYILSWIVGYIAPFAPGGLGVREGVMALGLSSLMPSSLAVGVSFLARIWITVFELVIFGAGLLIRPKKQL